MRSDTYNEAHELDYILSEISKLGQYVGLSPIDARKLRLLAEETLGLTVRLFNHVRYTFYVENEGLRFSLCLSAKALVDLEQRDKMLSLSSRGDNMSAKGVLGRISSVFENLMMNRYEAVPILHGYGDMMGCDMYFCMDSYYETVPVEEKEKNWDGLEKSIIANLASDVKIGVKSGQVEMVSVIDFTGKDQKNEADASSTDEFTLREDSCSAESCHVTVSGRLDASHSSKLREQLLDYLSKHRINITLNMRNINRFSSSGVSVIHDIHKKTAEQGGRLHIEEPSEHVRYVLNKVALDELLLT